MSSTGCGLRKPDTGCTNEELHASASRAVIEMCPDALQLIEEDHTTCLADIWYAFASARACEAKMWALPGEADYTDAQKQCLADFVKKDIAVLLSCVGTPMARH